MLQDSSGGRDPFLGENSFAIVAIALTSRGCHLEQRSATASMSHYGEWKSLSCCIG